MKTFDLTFNGALLPEHDPSQVKNGLADLFNIEDPAVVEQLFCGETIILRRGLDRKSAAEYFNKISKRGGKALLVASDEPDGGRQPATLRLRQEGDKAARVVPHPDPERPDDTHKEINYATEQDELHHQDTVEQPGHQLAANSAITASTPIPTATGTALSPADQDTVVPEKIQQELRSVRAQLARTTREAEMDASRLQRRIGQFNRIADEEIQKIAELRTATRDSGQQEINALTSVEQERKQTETAEVDRIRTLQKHSQQQAETEIVRLEGLIGKKTVATDQALEALDKQHKDIRVLAGDKVQRIEQQIKEIRDETRAATTVIEQQCKEIEAQTQREVEALQKQQNEIQRISAGDILKLQQQEKSTTAEVAEAMRGAQQQLQGAARQQEEELKKLDAMEQDISQKRAQGIATTEEAHVKLQCDTAREVQRLRLREQNLLQRESAVSAMATAAEKVGRSATQH